MIAMNLRILNFSDDSELLEIEDEVFGGCPIQSLTIPSKVINLENGWCSFTSFLNRIILRDNEFYKLYDEKFIIGKSSPFVDKYDVLIFFSSKSFGCKNSEFH